MITASDFSLFGFGVNKPGAWRRLYATMPVGPHGHCRHRSRQATAMTPRHLAELRRMLTERVNEIQHWIPGGYAAHDKAEGLRRARLPREADALQAAIDDAEQASEKETRRQAYIERIRESTRRLADRALSAEQLTADDYAVQINEIDSWK